MGFLSPCNRELTEAHGSHWIVCLVLQPEGDESKEDLRYALAVKCDASGRVLLPSEGAQLIQFIPAELTVLRELHKRAAAAQAELAARLGGAS